MRYFIGSIILTIFLFAAWKLSPISWYPNELDGDSMTQYGLYNGDSYRIYFNKECNEGDFCSFTCTVDKCIDGQSYVKKVVSIEDGCYTFWGNPEPWENQSNPGKLTASVDSRVFGCLTQSEFKMDGVVTW